MTQYKKIAQSILKENFSFKTGERVLIISSEDDNAMVLNRLFFEAALELGARTAFMVQTARGQSDEAELAVVAAVLTEPDILLNFRQGYFGIDPHAVDAPYIADGKQFRSPVQYVSTGKKVTKAAWGSSLPPELFFKLLDIDYRALKQHIAHIAGQLGHKSQVRVTSPGGTDLTFSIQDRQIFDGDDGDFSEPGGHNLPCGEVFVSPALKSAQGRLVLDGCIAVDTQTMLIDTPIVIEFDQGYATSIKGKKEADLLKTALKKSAKRALDLADTARAKDVYHLGEFGIGCNPKATVSPYLIESEKAYGTCHFAIGSNYDQDDALPFNHYDGVVLNPKIRVDGQALVIK